MWYAYWSSSSSLPNINILFQTVWELWHTQDFGFMRDNYIKKKERVVSLALDNIIKICLRVSKLWSTQEFGFRGDTGYIYWSSSSFLPNIIKICLRVSKLWSAQDFGFRGDDYITKKVGVVSPAHYMPTGPPLHSYQILPKYVWGYQSYGMHKDESKISSSGEIIT